MKYTFTGDYPELFLDLGRELQPGETFDSEKTLEHPRLQIIEEKPAKLSKAEVND